MVVKVKVKVKVKSINHEGTKGKEVRSKAGSKRWARPKAINHEGTKGEEVRSKPKTIRYYLFLSF